MGILVDDLLLWTLAGLLVGWMAALIDRTSESAVLVDALAGVVGAIIGGGALALLGIVRDPHVLLATAAGVVGAATVLAVLRAISSVRAVR